MHVCITFYHHHACVWDACADVCGMHVVMCGMHVLMCACDACGDAVWDARGDVWDACADVCGMHVVMGGMHVLMCAGDACVFGGVMHVCVEG